MSRYFKAAIPEMGGAVFGEGNADALTVVSFGRGGHDQIRERLVAEFGLETADGQDQLQDLVIRVGHFGMVTMDDMKACVQALKSILERKRA